MKFKNMSLLFMSLILVACQDSTSDSITDVSKVMATVGDYQVTEQYLSIYLKNQGIVDADDQQFKQALDVIIKELALSYQAKKSGLHLSNEQEIILQQAKHRALSQVVISQYLAANPVTEEAIKAEYKKVTIELKGQEYHVHHMLFQNELAALEILDKIAAGEKYLDLEQAFLALHPNVKNVGDIGWVNLKQVPEAFRAPLQKTQPGTVYNTALVSQFGVHVLYLADKRALVPPDYDQVKKGIQKSLENNKIERYQQLAVIKAKAKVAK